jgi:hypothetical protein
MVLLQGFTLADFQQLSRLVSIVLNADTEYPLLMWRMVSAWIDEEK